MLHIQHLQKPAEIRWPLQNSSPMTRRDFSDKLLQTLTSVAFLDTLFRQQLLAKPVQATANRWLKDLQTMCRDLRVHSISPLEWQKQVEAFHHKLPLEDLLNLIDFENSIKDFAYPDLGVVTKNTKFPKISGISENQSFIGRIFGMQKDRAIIPHGHKHMTSCHRVLKGEFLLRQYDRVEDRPQTMVIRPTIEEIARTGSFSSISDQHNNVHWLVAQSKRAYTFDVIVADLDEKPTEIDNIDIAKAVRLKSELLEVRKLSVEDALPKYGKSHH